VVAPGWDRTVVMAPGMRFMLSRSGILLVRPLDPNRTGLAGTTQRPNCERDVPGNNLTHSISQLCYTFGGKWTVLSKSLYCTRQMR
jgi:hypothetical protein